MRSIRKQVTFRRPFRLNDLDGTLPAGTYQLDTEEELIDALSFPAWRRLGSTLQVMRAGATEYVPVSPEELHAALLRDALPPDTVAR
jgi:hypothetical protein